MLVPNPGKERKIAHAWSYLIAKHRAKVIKEDLEIGVCFDLI